MINYLHESPEVVSLDFEFNKTLQEKVNPVSCVTYVEPTKELRKWWLHNNFKNQAALKKYLSQFKLVIGYSTVAEGRAFISLGLNPMDFQWYDQMVEYRMMTNHNDNLQWGKQLVRGKVRTVKKPKPKYQRTEQDNATGFVATHSLAEAQYKLTGTIRDTDHKTATRDLIISAPERFTKSQRKQILGYNADDVTDLPNITRALVSEFKRLRPDYSLKRYLRGALERGAFQAATAIMESKGYPINYHATKNFANSVGSILFDVQKEINELFPKIKPFKFDNKTSKFTWQQKVTRDWVKANHHISSWMKTDSGDVSLSLEAFQRFYDFKHSYPEDNFGAQMVRFLKLKQNLYGFSSDNQSTSKKSFWDNVGPDRRVRPYLNAFKAQSSRSQPAATGFMFLKPAWMRALVEPPKGKFMGGIDFGSEEFFISALKSRDKNMIQAYLSGDPYFYFAKLARAVPQNAKREQHEAVRDLFKATTLGLSYQMSKIGLAVKLTQDTGKKWDEDQAQEMIDMFYDAFPKLKDYQELIIERYQNRQPIELSDGWTMWCDNPNHRSVGNCPIQGEGGVIMRRAVVATMKKGIYVPFPLHDALYMEGDIGSEKDMITMRECMRDAFVSVFDRDLWKYAEQIRLDPVVWSKDYPKEQKEIIVGAEKWKIPCKQIYIDRRSLSEYEKFSPYFKKSIASTL